MKACIALLCLGVALAEIPSHISEYKIKNIQDTHYATGKEFEYYYDSQILNGIPQTSNRRSGQRIQAVVKVQIPSPDTLLVQLKHIKFGSLSQILPNNDRQIFSFEVFDKIDLKQEQRQQLETPIHASRKDGMIKDLKYSSSEPSWVVNIKRSVLNLLSNNLQAKNAIPLPQHCEPGSPECRRSPARPSNDVQYFTSYEETLEGSCETTYTIVQNPDRFGRSEHVLNVTKSINLAKCKSIRPGKTNERPEIRYNFHLADICPSCKPNSKFVNASTVMRIDCAGTKDRHLVERVSAISEYTIPDYAANGAVINAKVNASLILIQSGPIAAPLPSPQPASSQKHGSSLIYSLSWDAMKEHFFMDGSDDFNARSPYVMNADKVAIAKNLLKDLAMQLAPSKPQKNPEIQAPTTFLRLVKVIRMMSSDELEKVHNAVFTSSVSGLPPQEARAVKDIVHTAMGAAATQPAVDHLVSKIQQGELSQYQASIAIRQLQNTRVASKKMIDQVKNLCTSISKVDQPALKQSCMLALGSLYRSFCMPRDNKFAVNQQSSHGSHRVHEKCSSATRREAVQYFVKYLKDNQEWNHQVLALKALTNAALPEAVPEISKIVKDSQQKETVRGQAVSALRNLRSVVPEQIISLCMPVFMDQETPVTVRVSCAHAIISSNPSPAVLQSMVVQLNEPDSREVKSFVYSYLSSLANNTQSGNPCLEKLSANARIALQLAKPEVRQQTGSLYSHNAFYTNARKYGIDVEPYSVMSNSSILPSMMGVNINSNFLGFFNKDIMSLGIHGQDMEKALLSLYESIQSAASNEAPVGRHRRSASAAAELRQKLQDMTENFESLTPENSRMVAYARILGQEIGFLPLDQTIVEWLKEKLSMDQIEAWAQPQVNINFATLASETMIKLPTTMGLPIVIRTQTPVIAQIKGTIGRRNEAGYLLKGIDLLPSIISKSEMTMEVWSPVLNSGIKVREQSRVVLPIRGSIKQIQQAESGIPQITVEMTTPQNERELVTLKVEPYAFTRFWNPAATSYEKPKLQLISSQREARITKIDQSAQAIGVQFHVRGRFSNINFEQEGNPATPLAGPTSVHLIARKAPGQAINKIVFKLTAQLNKLVESPLQSTVHSIKISNTDSEPAESFASPQHYETKLHLQAESQPAGVFRALNIVSRRSPTSRLQITEAKVFKDRSQSSPMHCAKAELLFPEIPQSTSELDRQVNARYTHAWGPNCKTSQSSKKIEIQEQAERTKDKREMEKRSVKQYHMCKDGKRSPIECYQYLKKASELNLYTFRINHNDMPVWAKNVTQKLFGIFLAKHSWNSDVNKYEAGPANQIHAVVTVDPLNARRMNVTVEEPGQTVTMKDINTIPFQYNTLTRQVFTPSVAQLAGSQAVCIVSDRKIESFDQRSFQAPLTDCWSVLAKDCSTSANFAVLMKRVSMDGQAKKLRVLTQTQLVEIVKDADTFVLRVNGEEKEIPDSKVARLEPGANCYVRKLGSSKVKVVLPVEKVTVYFDGESAAVSVSPSYIGQQCGLCGHYNRDSRDIFRNPKSQLQQSVIEFFKQYQLQEGSCQVAPTAHNKYRADYSASDESSEYSDETPARVRTSRTVTPVKRNRIQNQEGQICMSIQAVNTCPTGYFAKETVNQQVEFGCIADHYDALEIERIAPDEQIQYRPEFEDRYSGNVRIATKCSRY